MGVSVADAGLRGDDFEIRDLGLERKTRSEFFPRSRAAGRRIAKSDKGRTDHVEMCLRIEDGSAGISQMADEGRFSNKRVFE